VERVQGFPDDWTRPRHFDERQADRIDSLRYHAVGNAVTPPVAEWVGRRLAKVMRAQDLQQLREGAVAAE
jgi:DNA (cytosine-5)-methyltransferase 1